MKLKFLATSIALILGFYSGASAITVLPLSEEELTRRATVIVVGEVEDVFSGFDQSHATIYTYIKVRVTTSLKGEIHGDYITLRQMGGTVDDETVTVPGAPIYELGDEVLLFAGPLGQTGYYGVLGIFYGKYDIELDPSTGTKYVRGPSFEAIHTDPVTLEPLPQRIRPDKVYLNDFLSEIRSYLKKM